VHRDLVRNGPNTIMMVMLPSHELEHMREYGKLRAMPQLDRDDERAQPFQRLLDAVSGNADRLSLEVALAEAVSAFSVLRSVSIDAARPVRRAMEYLYENISEPITLADLAAHADFDKFHLCRAFRAQIGMPPHTYLTHLRISRAKELLSRGTRASQVASLVGFYDQAALTRHFRRIVGTTPARFGKTRTSVAIQ
jgi:AraC-like DNA-binding protein